MGEKLSFKYQCMTCGHIRHEAEYREKIFCEKCVDAGKRNIMGYMGERCGAEKPEFKPYAVLFTDDGIVRKAIADDGDWVTLAEKQGSYPSPKRNESVVRITNEHKALRILRDVCGEDDLIEKVKEYARLSSGLRQGWSEHYIHYQKLLNFIESEQAKMKEGSNG